MTNIAELLRNAPKGLKLYSPLFGEVAFGYIGSNDTIWVCLGKTTRMFSSEGKYRCSVENITKDTPECLLFPSEDCRTWEKWKLPVEPKFKVGDWIVCWDKTYQILYNKYTYIVREINGLETRYEHSTVDENGHLWTIQDAEDGDVITNGKLIVIFNKLEEPAYRQRIIAYVGLDLCDRLQITEDTWQLGVDKAMPATKEQRDLLFAKMKEAGYQWDVDKKELCKIHPHYDIANFHASMPVLVRADNNCRWEYSVFSRITGNEDWPFAVCNGVSFTQCIPFEGNEHLLGTSDMPSEEYINW